MKALQRIAAPLAGLLLLIAGCGGEPSPGPAKNLVLICLDTVRFDTMFLPERAGLEDALTAELGDAVVFTRAHAPAPWTVPSVTSTLTGLYPAQHGAGRFDQAVANLDVDVPSRLADQAQTLAERLAGAGFATPAFVAHPWFRSGYGMEQGFSELHLVKGSKKLTGAGAAWMREYGDDGRFFLYLHLMGAHDPHLKTEEFDRVLSAADPAVLEAARRIAPEGVCDDADAPMCHRYQVYAASVMAERRALAGVLSALESQGRSGDTVVMVYSDHGEEFHDHLEAAQRLDADPRGIHGFGHGNSLYQEQLHVPLLAWHPALPGQADGQVVSLVDVVPTLLDWLDVDAPSAAFGGRAVTGLERGEAKPFRWADYNPARWPDTERPIYASGIAYGPEQLAVIEDGWKYVWHEQSGDSRLFDLERDPAEKHPVSDSAALARLEPALDRYFEWFSSEGFEAPDLTDDQLEQLKGVGYLQGAESGDDGGDDSGNEADRPPRDPEDG